MIFQQTNGLLVHPSLVVVPSGHYRNQRLTRDVNNDVAAVAGHVPTSNATAR